MKQHIARVLRGAFLLSLLSIPLITTNTHCLQQAAALLGKFPLEKEKQDIDKIKEQKGILEKEKEEVEGRNAAILRDLKEQKARAQRRLESSDDEYSRQKLTLLSETQHVIKEHLRTMEQSLAKVDELIAIKTQYLDDPTFSSFQKEYQQTVRRSCSFEDLQKFYEATRDQENLLHQLAEQRKSSMAEVESNKRILAALQDDFKRRADELDANNRSSQMFRGRRYEPHQVADLVAKERQLYQLKIDFEKARVDFANLQRDLVVAKEAVAEGQFGILKNQLRAIKQATCVTEGDVEQASEELDRKKHLFYAVKDVITKEMDRIEQQLKKRETEFAALSEAYQIPRNAELEEWLWRSRKTADEYLQFVQVASLNTKLKLLRHQHELVEAQNVLEDEKIRYDKVNLAAKKTYRTTIINRCVTEDDVSRELKTYESHRTQARSELNRCKERSNLMVDQLGAYKKTLEQIESFRQHIASLQAILFANRQADYTRIVQQFDAAIGAARELIDVLGKLSGVYATQCSVTEATVRLSDFIINELKSVTFWYRSDYAISWQGISNIVPDVMAFLSHVQFYVTRLNVATIVARVNSFFQEPFSVFILFLKLIAIAGGLLLFRRYGAHVRDMIAQRVDHWTGLVRAMALLVLVFLSFGVSYFWGIFTWLLLYSLVVMQSVQELTFYLAFYLLSIAYLLYLASSFIRFFVHFNVKHDYVFLAEDFQRRFVAVLSVLAYATIIIMLFRHAFLLVDFCGSSLPTILLAVNFIIFQIALMLLITREQITHLIPTEGTLWSWVHDRIDTYFYHIQALVIAIIVMSNPYVGYGKLVLYSFFGFVYTGILIAVLLWLHGFFKRVTSQLFFVTEDEVARERFANAKMWFGLFIIASFMLFVFLGIVVGARIWGKPITFTDIHSWLNMTLMHGSQGPITLLSLGYVIGFVLIGFVISHALNRYVLDKIFDLLLVDAGVQYTITSITGYVVFVLALFLGLQGIGLGATFQYAFGALALGLTYLLKEPLSDFIAYFVILVQRPIKIGDLIRIDQDTQGVVRRITVRSVVLRRRNSTTIVVPNSYVINHVVTNWNYVRGFIAFDDIIVTIDYTEDPALVRDLLVSMVESHPRILRTPRPIVRLDNFGEYGFVYLIRGFMSSTYTLDQWDIASDIRLSIAKAFYDKGIKIAMPIRIVRNDQNNTKHYIK